MGYRPYHTNFFGSVIYRGTRNGEPFGERDTPNDDDFKLFELSEWNSELNQELRKLGARFVSMEEDGGDSRIDCDGFVVLWDAYTDSTQFATSDEEEFSDNFLDGDTKGSPSKALINLVKKVVERHGLPWYKPEREKRSYII